MKAPASLRNQATTRRRARAGRFDVAVVICAHSQERWKYTLAAVQSVSNQRPRPTQVVLVIDHDGALAARARRELPTITVLDSTGLPGLSGARNTGLRASRSGITAFMDDDAAARPGWLAALTEPYADPRVVATGGSVHPVWLTDRPAWLPPEFDWVVGCSYRGLPSTIRPVRNPIGANMSLRTARAISVGGFHSALGRQNGKLGGCEETDLAIRLSASQPASTVIYTPSAAVDHVVGFERATFSYFLRRCWREGWSKGTVVKLVGLKAGLSAERHQIVSVIPTGMIRELRHILHGDLRAGLRSCAMILGLVATVAGFVARSLRVRPRSEARTEAVEAVGRVV